MTMKLLVIVPAYNEEASIGRVIEDLREHVSHADVLVVDDGSHDGTASVAGSLGVRVLRIPFNLGIGGAVQAGYVYALRYGYDAAVQFDGDGQHLASEIATLMGPIEKGEADIVVGSRFLNRGSYKAPVLRRAGIWVFSMVLSRILGMPMTDTTSGFRMTNRKTIEFFSRLYPDDYPEVESLVLLHHAGLKIAEKPVCMRERTGGSSSITAFRSVYYMVKVLLAVFVDMLKKVR